MREGRRWVLCWMAVVDEIEVDVRTVLVVVSRDALGPELKYSLAQTPPKDEQGS